MAEGHEWQGGMHGGGHLWQGGGHVWQGGMRDMHAPHPPRQILQLRHTVNEHPTGMHPCWN